ncbi:hypothetical protein SUGI_0523960 [Cryptomeria japonica]|uniref:light-harvesting complex-like protein OHP2, chloroplastic n=1 Tax=Cryptomeria japonica TaxID=3369 RepID=UPI002408BD4B|nr:light-harvesting complex-like protein OHP2, chloroplastic [Cryptomeria japonica]GLJ26827.1 hypothetical protein SUGI_0523960 [Cryptomeria japonica]
MTMSLASPLPPIPFSSTNSKLVGSGKVTHKLVFVRSSSNGSEGTPSPLRRPGAPIKEATPPIRPVAPVKPILPSPPPPSSSDSSPPSPPPPSVLSTMPSTSAVTIEFQRQKAKELQEYFQQKKAEDQVSKSKAFGFTPKNEISNGRWAMFGFAVGLLTEYATGSSFVDQMKILISNFGIADLE